MPDLENHMPRWNWIWVAPILLFALTVVEVHTAPNAIQLVKLGWQRWSWGALISPSAYVCESAILGSVWAPIQGIAIACGLLSSPSATAGTRRYLPAVLVVAFVLALPFITDAIIWGTFPFGYDNTGAARLRLLPFIPWPDGPFMTY